MTREEAMAYCLSLKDVYLDYPFDEEWQAMRHKANRKTFAFIFKYQEMIWINVKCEPLKGQFLRENHEDIRPAYHMNKKHWISIILGGKLSDEEIKNCIHASYQMTSPKKST